MSPLVIGFIITGVGVLLGAVGLLARSKASYVLATPVTRTGDVARATGPASCEGAVRAQQVFTAPCTNTPCVYFQLVIEAKVKEKKRDQTSTKWKTIATHHRGSTFAIDDGSGAVPVLGQGELDGDLEQTFAGAPPGGPGLGIVASYVTTAPRLGPTDEILGYKVTEKLIRAEGNLFVLGAVHHGQLTAGAKKLLVSARGRAAIVGAARPGRSPC